MTCTAGFAGTVDRLAGSTRYETATQVTRAAAAAGMAPSRTWVATVANWPDSLAVGAAAGAHGDLPVFVHGRPPSREPVDFRRLLAEYRGKVDELRVVGGDGVIDPRLATALLDAVTP